MTKSHKKRRQGSGYGRGSGRPRDSHRQFPKAMENKGVKISRPSASSGGWTGNQRWLSRLIENKEARISTLSDAERFVSEMTSFDNKVDLLAKLDDERKFSRERVRESLSCIRSNIDVEKVLVPMLQVVLNKETVQPLYEPLRNRVLMMMFQIPCLLESLDNLHTIAESSKTTAIIICKFLLALAKPFGEARQSSAVKSLAIELKERGDVPEATVLCAVLLIGEENEGLDVAASLLDAIDLSTINRSPVCWVTDREPPGGRHSNDWLNFRDLQIVPTIDELACKKQPWLPLADQSNAVIKNLEA